MFTDRNGRPCQASDDSLVAVMFRLMPKKLEETVNEDFDRLLAYRSTKQSVRMSEIKRQNRRDDPMQVDACSKGKRKGKKGLVGLGKGKGQNQVSNVKCWNCGKSGHYASDCRERERSGQEETKEAERTKEVKERLVKAKAKAI